MSSRKSRRRRERARDRERTRTPSRVRVLSPIVRIGLIAAGALLVLGGISLIAAGGSSTNAARLSRVAGIMIIVGLVVAFAGLIGKM